MDPEPASILLPLCAAAPDHGKGNIPPVSLNYHGYTSRKTRDLRTCTSGSWLNNGKYRAGLPQRLKNSTPNLSVKFKSMAFWAAKTPHVLRFQSPIRATTPPSNLSRFCGGGQNSGWSRTTTSG